MYSGGGWYGRNATSGGTRPATNSSANNQCAAMPRADGMTRDRVTCASATVAVTGPPPAAGQRTATRTSASRDTSSAPSAPTSGANSCQTCRNPSTNSTLGS